MLLVLLLIGHGQAYIERSPDPAHAFHTLFQERAEFRIMTNDVYKPEKTGFWLRGRARTRLLWSDHEPASVTIHSLVRTTVHLLFNGQRFELNLSPERQMTLLLPGPVEYSSDISPDFQSLWIYCDNGIRPSKLSQSLDRRYLGCFVSPHRRSYNFAFQDRSDTLDMTVQ